MKPTIQPAKPGTFLPATILLAFLLFCFTAGAQPVINSFSPASGVAGTTITISGSGFNTTAANNIIYFGPVKTTAVTATSAAITVKVPAGAAYQPISVLNMPTHLSATSAKPFIPLFTTGAGSSITNASFKPVIGITVAAGAQAWAPKALAVGDIDGDGKPDIVMITRSNSLSVFRNISSGGALSISSFAAPVDFILSSSYGAYNLALADFDGDGKLDIAVANMYAAYITVFLNKSSAGSINSSSLAQGVDIITADAGTGISVADFDKDGKPDIVATNTNAGDANSISVLKNTCPAGAISFAAAQRFITGRGCTSVSTGDIDGDGKTDIVTANQVDHSFSILRNTATNGSITASSFANHVDFSSTTQFGPTDININDIDNDGKPDIIIADGGGAFKNKSSAGAINSSSFTAEAAVSLPGNYFAAADINADGKPDIVSGGGATGGNITISQNNTATGIINTSSFGVPAGFNAGLGLFKSAVADFDGDGRPDIAASLAGYSGVNAALGILQNTIGLVTVPDPTGTIQTSAQVLKLHIKDTAVVTAKLYNKDGTLAASQPTFTWVSKTTAIATASKGKIVATGLGTTYVAVSDTLNDTAYISVTVVADSITIPSTPVNISFNPVSLSLKTNSQQAIPAYVITDYKGKTLTVTPTFMPSDATAVTISGGNIKTGAKTGLFQLTASVNNVKLNGGLYVYVYNGNASTKPDTSYTASVHYAPGAFTLYNVEADAVALNITRTIIPAHAAGATYWIWTTGYTAAPDSIKVGNPNIVGLSKNGRLLGKHTGSTDVTAWYNGASCTFKVYVAFDFTGSWKGVDKNKNNYSICFQSILPTVIYIDGQMNYQLDNTFGNGTAKFQAYPDVKLHQTAVSYPDTIWHANALTKIGVCAAITVYTGHQLDPPIFQCYWNGDAKSFLAVSDKTGNVVFNSVSLCADSLEDVLDGDSSRTWITSSEGLYDYKLRDIDEYAVFNKTGNTVIEYYNSDGKGKFAYEDRGTWSVKDNNKIFTIVYDTASTITRTNTTLYVSAYTDSLITIDSIFQSHTNLTTGKTESEVEPGPFYFYVYGPQAALPVALLNFNATLDGKFALLQWQTASEINTGRFNIQRSTDGRNFTTIGQVHAAGNSSKLLSYSYPDPEIFSLNENKIYYRLEEVDLDGRKTYSSIKAITLASGDAVVTIAPNPVTTMLNITAHKDIPGAVLSLTDMNGKTLYTTKQSLQKGQLITLNLGNYAGGLYIVRVISSNVNINVKIIKQ